MTFSATASRSAVLTPGATASRVAASASATTRPAARILRICATVLYWMSGSRRLRLTTPAPASSAASAMSPPGGSASVRAESVDRPDGDALHGPGGVDANRLALRAVVVDQGRGVAGVDPQPFGHGLGPVVLALEQLPAAAVADPFPRRRIEVDVPDLAAAAAGAPAGEPPDHLVVVDHQLQYHVQSGPQVGEQLVQGHRLRDGTRKTVQQEPVRGVRLGEPVPHHVDRDLVGDEVAGVHVTPGRPSQRRPLRDVLPEDVAGGDLRHGEVRGDELRLRPLARAGWADQDQPHGASRLREWATAGRRTAVSVAPQWRISEGTLRSSAASTGSRSA